MAINGIPTGYDAYSYMGGFPTGSTLSGYSKAGTGAADVFGMEEEKKVKNPGESTEVLPGKKVSPAECETCNNRKYQDGSDEMVSFKSAAKIAPEAAANRVRAHEQEHVVNAYQEAEQKGGEVLNASVQIHTSTCPDCGKTFVSGGTTTSQIKYPNEENPYQKAKKLMEAMNGLRGANINMAV